MRAVAVGVGMGALTSSKTSRSCHTRPSDADVTAVAEPALSRLSCAATSAAKSVVARSMPSPKAKRTKPAT